MILKKIKEWKIKLIKKYSAYIESGLTYNQMAELCGAPSDEAIRSFIRRHGALQIKSLANVDEVIEVKKEVVSDKNSFNKVGYHIVLGCIHVPFQNTKVLSGILELLQDIDVSGFHLIGDFLDMNSLSSHDTGRFTAVPGLTLTEEYKAGNVVLDQFDRLLPKDCEKSFLYGNHEARVYKWMANMQNAKTPLEEPHVALSLENRGYVVKTDWAHDYFKLGAHLEILHGTYFNVHTSKKHVDTLRSSCMFAHTHRIQSYIEGKTGGFNIGWLGDENSPAFSYASRPQKAQWQNGFALVYIDEVGDYYVHQIIVNDNRFVFNGKVY